MTPRDRSANRLAWNTRAYEAWLAAFGPPAQRAAQLRADPAAAVRRFADDLGEVGGQRIANLLGSHGGRAVPLALLGAHVTVVDFGEGNRRYALEVAAAAGVHVEYICADVLDLPREVCGFDAVLMEGGVLHHFDSLADLFAVCRRLLKPGGRVVLRDFHPVATKLLDPDAPHALRAGADYFDRSLHEGPIAYHDLLPASQRPALRPVRLRRWTVGEILTSLAGAGFRLVRVGEEPHPANRAVPGRLSILARVS